jgi:transcription initiation factor TFIID TATA-box-binding protein
MKVVFSEPVQENIVGSSDLGTTIDLDKASLTLKNAMYELEQVPALILRMTNPKAVVYLFASGKLVCTSKNNE